ncbi:glycerol-3-phosphate dehydrogenase/oxidase [Algibacillus agarilyticus]|uniref:glycerol-3-phosphate dehydrogenase/oxidase n=1 Tax=Algibacillus agarilyticus TaxID=2234133 RepID=UPI000DD0B630|nr:FAD-dependent oxidoreductase [Algibacillus agarilyticus]
MQHYDVTIIGGGIAGAGVAQAAAAAGYRVLLIEKGEFAKQTSASSSKLIHGGLRYLESGQINLVYSALKERRALLNLAPDLVKPIPFYIPVYQHSLRGKWLLRAGLFLYQCLCFGDKLSEFSELNKKDWSSLSGLKTDGLKAVFQYWDAQTDDHFLALAVLNSAEKLGASLLADTTLSHCQANANGYQLSYHRNNCADDLTLVQTSMIINAAGPWVNQILRLLAPNIDEYPMDWVQGTHIEIAVPALSHIYYLESHLDDRVIFVMPWRGHTLVGTTEHVLKNLPDKITATDAEVDYLMAIFQHGFPEYQNIRPQIINVFAGVRVLPKAQGKAFNRQRESVIYQDATQPTIISLYGGKLTTFRATSKKVLKKIASQLGKKQAIANIDELPLTNPKR